MSGTIDFCQCNSKIEQFYETKRVEDIFQYTIGIGGSISVNQLHNLYNNFFGCFLSAASCQIEISFCVSGSYFSHFSKSSIFSVRMVKCSEKWMGMQKSKFFCTRVNRLTFPHA